MIFKISESNELLRFDSAWDPREVDLEKYILGGAGSEDGLLNSALLGEQLLLIGNQIPTADRKRADILALDRQGNGVVIELKRDQGMAGVETQALQYLAAFSPFTGRAFVDQFSPNPLKCEDQIRGFLGDISIDEINKRHRIVLVARSFDRTLFSMGKWFGSNGVAFRCIEYTPFEIEGQRLLAFSTAFDHSPAEIFPMAFANPLRGPKTFWHNIGAPREEWWSYLVSAGELPASFDNERGDEGEQLLRSYVKGDRIVAYAKGFGAIGWGQIEKTNYRLVTLGSDADRMHGELRHRLAIDWRASAKSLSDGVPPNRLRDTFRIHHPVSTSVRIDTQKAEQLIAELGSRFRT